MRYLPLVWAAFRRHTTESLLTFLVLTVAFTLFGAMLALRAAYDHAIEVNRMDRLFVTARFCCTGLNIGRRAEIERMPGVRGVGLIDALLGFHQEPSMQLGVWMIDAGTIAAIPELRLTPEDWKLLQATPNGLLFTRSLAALWKVKAGDAFPVKTSNNRREDHAEAWPFTVVGVVNDPATQIDWMPNIYASYDYFEASRSREERGLVQFVVAIDNPDDARSICRQIDTRYANSETPSYCEPLRIGAQNVVDSTITMRQMSLGIGAAGLFMILFLCANSVAESVRERLPEFAVLKTIGFGDRQVATLVVLESVLPAVSGAVLGMALASLLSSFTSRLGEGSGLTLPAASISGGIVALSLGVALLVGAVSALLPLRRLRTMELAPVLALAGL
ncbi:MAG TPA: ABC transporter permease [Steroidobacteraceae bacterium]|nr:ABC transporter permease [Steroidobacteraceae bacterium]